MVRNVGFNILTPYDWVIFIQDKELRDVFGSGVDGVQPLLLEHTDDMVLNSSGSGRGEVVAENSKCRDGLAILVFSRVNIE